MKYRGFRASGIEALAEILEREHAAGFVPAQFFPQGDVGPTGTIDVLLMRQPEGTTLG